MKEPSKRAARKARERAKKQKVEVKRSVYVESWCYTYGCIWVEMLSLGQWRLA